MASRLKPRATPRRRRLRHGSGIFSESSMASNRPASPSRAASMPPPGRRRRLHGEREHFRVGRFGVTASEALKPRLCLLAALACPSAKYRAEVGIFGDFAGLLRTEISAADGDRIFWPEAQLLARGVGGQEQAAADLLARHVEKDRRRMQDRRLGALETGRKQAIERAFAGRARRFVGGVALAALAAKSPLRGAWLPESARIVSVTRWPSWVFGLPFNKAGPSAQPLTLPKVNAPSAPGCGRSAAMVG